MEYSDGLDQMSPMSHFVPLKPACCPLRVGHVWGRNGAAEPSSPALEPFADAAVGVVVGVVDEAGVDPEQDLDAVAGALGDGLRCDAGAELSGEPGGPQAAGVLGEVGVEKVCWALRARAQTSPYPVSWRSPLRLVQKRRPSGAEYTDAHYRADNQRLKNLARRVLGQAAESFIAPDGREPRCRKSPERPIAVLRSAAR